MKKLLLLLSLALLLAVCGSAQAGEQVVVKQDTTIIIETPDAFPVDGGVLEWISWLLQNWATVVGLLSTLVVVLEIIVSIIPTKRDLSIFTQIRKWLDSVRFISILTKNRSSEGGVFKVDSQKVT